MSDKKMKIRIEVENVHIRQKYKESIKRLECLKKIYPRDFYFPKWVKKSKAHYLKPSYTHIQECYDSLAKVLRAKYEATKTSPEIRFFNLLRSNSKKAIHTSIPIGSHIIDIFIPNLRSSNETSSRTMRGLAIELDGDVHNYESKMKKDARKGDELSFIGIGLTHIENWDFSNPSVKLLKQQYATLPTLDSRERKRLWRRIMLLTLALKLNNREFFQLFKINKKSMEDK